MLKECPLCGATLKINYYDDYECTECDWMQVKPDMMDVAHAEMEKLDNN